MAGKGSAAENVCGKAAACKGLNAGVCRISSSSTIKMNMEIHLVYIYIWRYACVYIYTYVCVYIIMYLCMYVRTYVCMYVCIFYLFIVQDSHQKMFDF